MKKEVWKLWPNIIFLLFVVIGEPLVREELALAMGTSGGSVLVCSLLIIILLAQTIGIVSKTYIIRQQDIDSTTHKRQESFWIVMLTVLNMCFTVLLWILVFIYTGNLDFSDIAIRVLIITGIFAFVLRDIIVLYSLRKPSTKPSEPVAHWVNTLSELHLLLFSMIAYGLIWATVANVLQLNPIALASESFGIQIAVVISAILVTLFLYLPLQFAYHVEQIVQAKEKVQYWQWSIGTLVFIAIATSHLITFS